MPYCSRYSAGYPFGLTTGIRTTTNGWIKSNNKFGHVTSEDSEGTLETLAKVTVDVDYPNEVWWRRYLWFLHGIEYKAYAQVQADSSAQEGSYSLKAAADTTARRLSGRWHGRASKDVTDKHFENLRGAAADALNDYDAEDLRPEFRVNSARAYIRQDDLSHGSRSRSAAPQYESTAEVDFD